MRRCFALLCALCTSLLLAPYSLAEPRQLVILNWSDYVDPELVVEFEKLHDAKVSSVFYSSDDHRTEMLLENNGQGYDLILVSGIDLRLYAKRGWLAPLDQARIPSISQIDPRWANAFDDAAAYGIPYFWGTTGIIYRSDLVKKPITSWLQLYRPEPELQSRISMMDSSKDLVGMALKSLGYSTNSTDSAQITAAEKLLLEQKPHVRSYQYVTLDENSPLLNGDIVASMMYSGDALMVQELNENLKYVLPSEGGNIWVDYFAVGAYARDPELAYAFLDFINQPANAARQAQFVYYATPNQGAEALLPEEFLQNSVIYPDSATLQASEFYSELPPRIQRQRNAAMAKILQ
uniref:polyamine ABC transporter substrate-binding protein n=1 Tax=Marinobacterium profundum TaxID=1714300 RepID=UPI000831A70C|nr:spermidine/putrescine ABC transporter substrate-binding protein [Marinobacterium profundum]